MFAFNSVPTVCTAKHITNWSFNDTSTMPVNRKAEYYLERLEYLKRESSHDNPYLSDFALIYVIVTEQQDKYCKDFLKECGFEESFVGRKDRDKGKQRHKESGDLHMYCVMPHDFGVAIEEAIQKYKKIKRDGLKEEIALREKYEYLTAYNLIKEGIFKGLPGNPGGKEILERLRKGEQVQLTEALAKGVTIEDLIVRVKMKFGVDLRTKKDQVNGWTIDRLKLEQQRWKDQFKDEKVS